MVKINPKCIIVGDFFSPSKLAAINGLVFEDKNEPGETGRLGIYRNKPTPYGSATIAVTQKSGDWSCLDKLLEVLEANINEIRQAGADEQCNFDFTREQIKKIYDLNVFFTISCWGNDME